MMNDKQVLDLLKKAYEMEEVMAALLSALAAPHVLTSEIPEPDRRKIHKMFSIIHTDTLEHQKVVSSMMRRFSGGSLGV
jgi:hypothetical protein